MKIWYKDTNFKPDTLLLIERAEEFIDDYEAQGYTLTLRQLYYQFVPNELIDNTDHS